MRIFKEKKIKQEVAQMIAQIVKVERDIDTLEEEMRACYHLREKDTGFKVQAKVLKIYPLLFESQMGRIENEQKRLLSLRKIYKEKLRELNKAMGEVKIMEKMKEKDWEKFKRKMSKDEQYAIEELLQYKDYREC